MGAVVRAQGVGMAVARASVMLVVYYGVCGDLAAFAKVTIARATRVSSDTTLARVHAGRQGHARRYRVLRVHLTTSRALTIVIAFPCGAMRPAKLAQNCTTVAIASTT